jgi:hypothetical protein
MGPITVLVGENKFACIDIEYHGLVCEKVLETLSCNIVFLGYIVIVGHNLVVVV